MTREGPVDARDPTDLGVTEAAAAISDGRLTAAELVAACLDRIQATDGEIAAWVTVDRDGAMAAATAADKAVVGGGILGPLHGVPVGVKDLIDVAGFVTTNGAGSFAHRTAAADSAIVARLREAGAIIIGKTVPTAFAYKDEPPTRNPWNLDRTPGGSSSGSAAAVAARHVPAAIGTQTIGSILRPAAFCGVVGLKGPHGAVPLDGVTPLSWSLDHGGPLTRSVADAVAVEAVLTGEPIERSAEARPPRLALPAALLGQAEPELRSHLDRTVEALATAGAVIEPIGIPANLDEAIEAGRLVLAAEAATVHGPMFADHGDEYPPEIGGLVRTGLERRATELVEAHREIDRFRTAMAPILARFDALLSPTARGTAPRIGAGTGDPGLCAPWSFIGVPSISLPIGLAADRLPLGIQLVGGRERMSQMLRAAAWVEQVVDFTERPPGPRPAVAGQMT
ncbi:MAG TPA: amidase [Candidatus Limnocylindrales bacterium]|nr:amidase [Candidatus Limnocylindrales bacterium]